MKWKKVKLLEEVALVLNYQSLCRRGTKKTVKPGLEMRQSTIRSGGSVEQEQLWLSWDLSDSTVCLIRSSSVTETQQLNVVGD